jgi:hypothetical protein
LQRTRVATLVAVACLCAAPVLAQTDGAPPDDVRVRIGPLSMNPTLSLTNIGVDHNVFNDPPDRIPRQDFTATVVPATDFWLHVGPTWVTSSLSETITWFQKYASERGATTGYKLGWVVPASRMTAKINGDWLNAKDRPGFEIDGRVRHKESNYTGSLDVNVFSKSYLDASASYVITDFADDAVFEGVHLNLAMNHHTTSGSLSLRQELTTLTSLSVGATRSMDQFVYASDRDSTTTAVNVALAFQPKALLRGGVSVGYSQFKPDSPDLPDFSGMVYTVDLTYVLLGSTRFAVIGSRGVQYSYDATQPYYVQTGITGSVAQEVFGPIDVAARVGTQQLAYRDVAGVPVTAPNREDHVMNYGIGIGYHLGQDLRLSFNVDKVFRDSRVFDRNYDNYLFTSSLTYGF